MAVKVSTFNASRKIAVLLVIATLFIIATTLNFGTWNVCGLSTTDRQHFVAEDVDRYNLDILALQETKTRKYLETTLPGHHRLFLFDQKHDRHGGLGFIVNKRFIDCIVSHHQISDRVVYMDFKLQPRKVYQPPCHIRIVNSYSPTNPKSVQNPRLADQFYDELLEAISVPARFEVWMLGDFNAKLGKRTLVDEENGLQANIGRHGAGRRNENGERLLHFLTANGLFAANTSFSHSSRHITTRTGWIRDRATRKSKPYFSQIDYILCKSRSKTLLTDARSYSGTKHRSDHKLVVAKADFSQRFKLYREKRKLQKTYNTTTLIGSIAAQQQYQQDLHQNIQQAVSDPAFSSNSTVQQFDLLFDRVKEAAVTTVGLREPQRKRNHSSDSQVVSMSEERKQLLQLLNNNEYRDRKALRAKINRLSNDITKRLKKIRIEIANSLADSIATTDEGRKMFEAVRQLSRNQNTDSVSVFNADNQMVDNDRDKADIIRNYFEEHYTGPESEPPIEPFTGIPRPLHDPISAVEVELAAKKLRNGKAVGPDGIPNEFLKHSPKIFFSTFAQLINQSFELHEHVPSFTEGYLTPLQKPGKPRGPLKSLRPLCLLNGTRKILSMIVLRRIQRQISQYTGPWQNAYKPGHSCANIVWTQRILVSVVKEKRWSLHKMGIDMSSAFDTIKRSVLLDILVDAGCSEDDLRLVRYLLANTKLKIKVKSTLSGEFIVTIGAFQGDSLSGNLFTLYLAAALYHLRAVMSFLRPNPPIAENLLPLEWEYADDVDFVDEEKSNLEYMLPICKEILEEWNLFVNESKTEFTHFYLADKNEVDDKGEPLRGREPWRSSISLGSKLCSSEDVNRRCVLANSAFQNYNKVWEQGKRIPLKTRLKIYEAQVVSILMYNCNSWAASKQLLHNLDVCHRNHLRRIINMTYPNIIRNKTLYKRCDTVPLSERVGCARWRMLGHILRSDNNSPAQLALHFAVESQSVMKGRVGRHQSNLFKTILTDLSDRNIRLVNTDDLYDLRNFALDRRQWRELSKI